MSLASSVQQGYRGTERSMIISSRFYKPDATTRGVMLCHSAGGSVAGVLDATVDDVPRAVGEVFPVCAFDFGDTAVVTGTTSAILSWGNDNAITSAGSALTWMQTADASGGKFATGFGTKTDKIYIYAMSMGALIALNWLVSLAAPANSVAAVALAVPVLDLDDIYQNNKGSWRASIGAAYGVTHPTAIPNLATHSPAAYSGANLAKLTMPIKIWSSSTDLVASTTASCQTWAASVANATVRDLGDVVHATGPATIIPDEVMSFFRAN